MTAERWLVWRLLVACGLACAGVIVGWSARGAADDVKPWTPPALDGGPPEPNRFIPPAVPYVHDTDGLPC